MTTASNPLKQQQCDNCQSKHYSMTTASNPLKQQQCDNCQPKHLQYDNCKQPTQPMAVWQLPIQALQHDDSSNPLKQWQCDNCRSKHYSMTTARNPDRVTTATPKPYTVRQLQATPSNSDNEKQLPLHALQYDNCKQTTQPETIQKLPLRTIPCNNSNQPIPYPYSSVTAASQPTTA